MTTTTYIWAWKDDDSVHVNSDESLETIIEIVINEYIGNSIDLLSVEIDGDIMISYWDNNNEENKEYSTPDTPWDVANFLRDFAQENEREDWFDIKEITQ